MMPLIQPVFLIRLTMLFSMVVTMAIITFGSRKVIIYASMTTIFYVVLYIYL